MKKIPDMIFVLDTNVEEIAVKESLKLNIPIVAIVDTNSDPTGINYPIPGNDDARRAINLYCDLIKETILDAQKNITKIETEDTKEEKKDDIKIQTKETTTKESKDKKIKKKPKVKTEKKTAKSIFSKIKSLATKTSK